MSIALINPFVFRPPIIRVFFDGQFKNTAVALTSANLTVNTVSTIETSGKDYAAFWMAILDNDSTAADEIARLSETTTRQQFNIESQDTTDQHSVGGLFAYAGGTNKTFNLIAQEEGALNNEIEDFSTMVLELFDNELSNSSPAVTTTTSAAGITKCSVTITEPGEYLIIASAAVATSAATGAQTVRISDGTNTYGDLGDIYAQDTTNWVPYWHVKRLTLTNETISLLAISDGTRTLSIREASLVALKLSNFEKTYIAEQTTEQTTTTTTAWGASGLTNAFTIENTQNYHLLLGSAMIRHGATNSSVLARLFNTSTSVWYSGAHRREPDSTADYYPTVVARVITFTQASNTIDWDFYVTGSTGRIKDMTIAILDTGVKIP